MKKQFGGKDSYINIELRHADGIPELRDTKYDVPKERLILATVEGGIDTCKVERRGEKTIITLTSPKGLVISDGWKIPKREARPRRASNAKATPR